MTCRDESGGRRNGLSAGHSGEHLTVSGSLTNQLGAHPTTSGECEKLCNHPKHWGGISTESSTLRSVCAMYGMCPNGMWANVEYSDAETNVCEYCK